MNELQEYLIAYFIRLSKIVTNLKRDLVADVERLTLQQILEMKWKMAAYSHIISDMMPDLLKSYKSLDELYTFLNTNKETFGTIYSYQVKADLTRRLKVAPDLYANLARFKSINYSYWD